MMKTVFGFLCLLFVTSSWGQQDARLEAYFQQYPEADANKDGVLSLGEAKVHRKAQRSSPAQPTRGEGGERRYSSAELAEIYEAREFQGVPYRFFRPDHEAHPAGTKFPLILSLHGAGGKGRDNLKNLKPWNGTVTEAGFQAEYPCFVVAPQSTGSWKVAGSVPEVTDEMIASYPPIWQKMAVSRPGFLGKGDSGLILGKVFGLLDELQEIEPIDVDRVYVLGHSMGGFGTFEALAEQPDRFAAGVPSAGGLSPWHDPETFAEVPVWAFHG
ncbi:MAG: alpha/beta fold hydrolase, partial [Verrucomicrobiota bacterium]